MLLGILLIDMVVYAGSDGAPAKEGMSGGLGDTKRRAEQLVGKGP